MKTKMRALVWMAALATAACGEDDEPTSPLDETEVANKAKSGAVSLATYSDGFKVYQSSVRPSFIDASASGKCTITESGPCRLISCAAERANLRTQNAGTVQVRAGTFSAEIPFDINSYPNILEQKALFNPGEKITFSAAGATVPSFADDVTAPGSIYVTAPVDGTVNVSRASDLAVTWTGTSASVVVFQLSGKIESNDVRFQCRFLGSETSGVIPKSAFELVAPGQYTADVFTRSRSVINAGEWAIALEGVSYAGVKDVGAYRRPALVE